LKAIAILTDEQGNRTKHELPSTLIGHSSANGRVQVKWPRNIIINQPDGRELRYRIGGLNQDCTIDDENDAFVKLGFAQKGDRVCTYLVSIVDFRPTVTVEAK